MESLYSDLRRRRRFITGIVACAAGLFLFAWLLNTPPGLLGKADAVGYAVCHRIDLRSFYLGERQLPLCARCTGMYLGALLCLAFQGVTAPRRMGSPPKRIIFVLVIFVLAFAVDGLNSTLSLFDGAPLLYTPSNTLRLITGLGMGLVIGATIFPAFHASVWQYADPRPALGDLKQLGWLILLMVYLALILLTQNPLILYPAAILSAAGVLLLLTVIYAMLWLVILRRENRYNGFQELVLPFMLGFMTGLLQIAILDWLRFALTGTWDGFHLG